MTNSAGPQRPFVTKLDVSIAPKLQAGLISQGFEMSMPPHTLFQGRKKGITCTLYSSGKLVVQGKEMASFIEFYLEPEILGSFGFTYQEMEVDQSARIGIDESGKGDVFGPLVVGGVFASGELILELKKMGVRDSKTMTDKAILALATQIRQKCPFYVLVMGPKKYNELYASFNNLNRLLAWGHATTIQQVSEKSNCRRAIVDQFAAEHVVETALKKKGIEIDLTQRTKGEEDIVVAAASIIARAGFLLHLEKMAEQWGLQFPKGASAKVREAGRTFIAKHGPEKLPEVAKMHFKTVDEMKREAGV